VTFLRRAGAAAAALAAAGVLAGAGPTAAIAAAPAGDHVDLTVDCVVAGADGSFRAVFGYDNDTGQQVTVPVGAHNFVNPDSIDGQQPTRFDVGAHRAAFVTPPLPAGTKAQWHLDGSATVQASSDTPACEGPVSLPADGNGSAPAVVLAVSIPVLGFAAYRVRRRRRRAG
jgi:hypothetical protein